MCIRCRVYSSTCHSSAAASCSYMSSDLLSHTINGHGFLLPIRELFGEHTISKDTLCSPSVTLILTVAGMNNTVGGGRLGSRALDVKFRVCVRTKGSMLRLAFGLSVF